MNEAKPSIDLDELIAEAREQAAYLRGVSRDGSMPYSGELLGSLADALVTVRAERDAALARIAELEAEGAEAWRVAGEQTRLERERAEQAEARIAEAAKLHRKRRAFAGDWDTCTCGYDAFPCPTAVALGLNEGAVAGDE